MAIIRIDKYLAISLGVSRGDAKLLLKSGKISVDGKTVTKADTKIDELSRVTNGEEAVVYKKHIYILMNKPSGILSASSDKRARTVLDILPEHLKRNGLSPVGRLDKDTTGLLIITDDGDFLHRVISPKSNIEKCYYAELDGEVNDDIIKSFARGITLASGEECKPALLEKAGELGAYVTISEGKYHQIKRMFGTVGLGVNRLHRIRIGKFLLPEDLKVGASRELTEAELALVE